MAGEGLVLMGRVSGAFGVRGEIKVFSYGRGPEAFLRAGLMYVGPNPSATRPLTISGLREHGGRLLISASEVVGREQAAALSGLWVYLDQASLPALAEDEYYWYQLKEARVLDTRGRELGRVKEIGDLGAHDLLLVRAPDGKEALIPVVEGVVLAVEAKAGRIIVDPPPGLLEAQGWPEEPEGEDGPGSAAGQDGPQDDL